jgi:CRISPR/Cas system CMR-associated protein Cmr3 (group 5 of RAMP superfamily)
MSLGSGQEKWVGMVEGSFILKTECISRIIKFDPKQKNKNRITISMITHQQ